MTQSHDHLRLAQTPEHKMMLDNISNKVPRAAFLEGWGSELSSVGILLFTRSF